MLWRSVLLRVPEVPVPRIRPAVGGSRPFGPRSTLAPRFRVASDRGRNTAGSQDDPSCGSRDRSDTAGGAAQAACHCGSQATYDPDRLRH